MEMLEKTSEALGGLWLSFSAKEKIVTVYAVLFVALMVAGVQAERKRKRESRELRDDLIAACREALRA